MPVEHGAGLEDKETLKRGPIFIEKDGQPEAVLLSVETYEALTGQDKSSKWRQEQLNRTQVDHEAFKRLLPELLKDHKGEWVAIHQGQVIRIGEGFGQLAQEMREGGYQRFYATGAITQCQALIDTGSFISVLPESLA